MDDVGIDPLVCVGQMVNKCIFFPESSTILGNTAGIHALHREALPQCLP